MSGRSNEVRAILESNGWNEDDTVDIEPYARALEDERYEVFGCVTKFLRRYGRLLADSSGESLGRAERVRVIETGIRDSDVVHMQE